MTMIVPYYDCSLPWLLCSMTATYYNFDCSYHDCSLWWLLPIMTITVLPWLISVTTTYMTSTMIFLLSMVTAPYHDCSLSWLFATMTTLYGDCSLPWLLSTLITPNDIPPLLLPFYDCSNLECSYCDCSLPQLVSVMTDPRTLLALFSTMEHTILAPYCDCSLQVSYCDFHITSAPIMTAPTVTVPYHNCFHDDWS